MLFHLESKLIRGAVAGGPLWQNTPKQGKVNANTMEVIVCVLPRLCVSCPQFWSMSSCGLLSGQVAGLAAAAVG